MTKLAAVFDLDGTLLDTIDDLAYAVNTALQEHGFPTHPREAYFYFVGNGARTLVERAVPENVESAVFEAVYARYSELYEAHWNVFHETLRRRARDAGRSARGRRAPGRRVQQGARPYARGDRHVLPEYLRRGVWQPSRRAAQARPAGVFDALAALDCNPAHAFYLGDTGVDIETGKRAGIYSAGALWGFRTADELTSAGADILCAAPSDALAAARAFYAKLK